MTRGALLGCLVTGLALGGMLLRVLCAPGSLSGKAEQPSPRELATVRSVVKKTQQRYDQPDAANQYYQLKRQIVDGDASPVQRYRRALAQMRRMPRHALGESSGLGSAAAEKTGAQLATWEWLGPGNVGGRTRVLVIDPVTPTIMYAGGVSGGLWKTTDSGRSWVPVADEIANLAVNALVMHPSDSRVLYVGTGEGYFREDVRGTWLPLRGAGLFRTDDGGITFAPVPGTDGEDFYWVNDILISPSDPRQLYVATRSGVWRSPDEGSSWKQILTVEVTGGCLDLAQRDDTGSDVLFASCGTLDDQATVYRSLDAAAQEPVWEAVLAEPGMGRTSLAVAPADQDVVYALAASTLPGPGGHYEQALHAVFCSTQGGAPGTWEARVRNTDASKLNTLLLTNPIAATYHECRWEFTNVWVPMGWYVNVIAVDPLDAEVVWAAGVDLFRSDDGGSNWGLASCWWCASEDQAYVHADQHGIVFHPDYDGVENQTILVTNDGGIFRSDNARAWVSFNTCDPSPALSWTSLNHGFGVTQFYHGAPFPDGKSYLGGTQDNGTVLGADARGTDRWLGVLDGDGGYVAVNHVNPEYVYAETQWGVLYQSFDGGRSFIPATSGIPPNATSALDHTVSEFLFIAPFVLDPVDPSIAWLGGRRLWRSRHNAETWFEASAALPGSDRMSALVISPHDSNNVLAGTSSGDILRSDQALWTSWTDEWSAVHPRDGFVSCLAFDPTDDRRVYATYAGFGGGAHVWRSSDGGASFRPLVGGDALPDIPVHCIVVDPANRQRLFLGTDLGVFTSDDGGCSWAVENTGFANAVTESLALAQTQEGTFLYAFTHGRGAWRVQVTPPDPSLRRGGPRLGS